MLVNFPNATRGQEGLLTHLQMTGNALEMHRRLLSGFTYADLMALAEAISTDKKTIGERIGINRRVFARRARAPSTRLTTDQSTRLLCLARVIDAGCRLFNGDTVAAKRWLHNPAVGLGGYCPIEMSDSIPGTEAVIDLVGMIEQGIVI